MCHGGNCFTLTRCRAPTLKRHAVHALGQVLDEQNIPEVGHTVQVVGDRPLTGRNGGNAGTRERPQMRNGASGFICTFSVVVRARGRGESPRAETRTRGLRTKTSAGTSAVTDFDSISQSESSQISG